MDKEFTTYNQALALKELGYNEPCLAWYVSKDYGLEIGKVIQTDLIKDAVVAPTFYQAFKWFREKHSLYGYTLPRGNNETQKMHFTNNIDVRENIFYKTYEEAESSCLDKLIEICKNK